MGFGANWNSDGWLYCGRAAFAAMLPASAVAAVLVDCNISQP